MRRILLVLSVATLMAAMMVATAAPAFADKGGLGGYSECNAQEDTTCVDAGRKDSSSDPGIQGDQGVLVTHYGNNPNAPQQVTVFGSGEQGGSGAQVIRPGNNKLCTGNVGC